MNEAKQVADVPNGRLHAVEASRTALVRDLGLTRDRVREVSLRYPGLDAAVRTAVDVFDQVKLQVDLRPSDGAAKAAAETAQGRLDAAIKERDAVTESLERLRKHETALAARLASMTDESLLERKASLRAANATAIRAEAPMVRRWAARVLLDWEVGGRCAGDLGRLLVEHLSGEFRHSTLTNDPTPGEVKALASTMRNALERGEDLP